MNSKNVIGEVNININAGLSVDERTFHICLDLVTIHAQNEGLKALVLIMPEDNNSHCLRACYHLKSHINPRAILEPAQLSIDSLADMRARKTEGQTTHLWISVLPLP